MEKKEYTEKEEKTHVAANSTNLGPILWHGPHQDAVKSIATNLSPALAMMLSNSVFVATTLTIV
jgi:hypothetical protein